MHDDPLWLEFVPIWDGLRGAGQAVTLAGGYGLFLKQVWLTDARDFATIVPLANWPDPTPRATNDVDLVIGLELLASAVTQSVLAGPDGQGTACPCTSIGSTAVAAPARGGWLVTTTIGRPPRSSAELDLQR